MKIQFLQAYTDPYDATRVYQPGWTAEFTDPDAQRAIDAGAAVRVGDDVRARKSGLLSTECVPADADALKAERARQRAIHRPDGYDTDPMRPIQKTTTTNK